MNLIKLVPIQTILKAIPVQEILVYILRLIQGISVSDWKIALQSVIAASKAYKDNGERYTSSEKFDYVWTAFKGTEMPEKAVRWLIETALSYAVYKGLVRASSTTPATV